MQRHVRHNGVVTQANIGATASLRAFLNRSDELFSDREESDQFRMARTFIVKAVDQQPGWKLLRFRSGAQACMETYEVCDQVKVPVCFRKPDRLSHPQTFSR